MDRCEAIFVQHTVIDGQMDIPRDSENPGTPPNLAVALAGNPAVLWYITNKCPEAADWYRDCAESAPPGLSAEAVRECEVFVLDALDWAVVYVYPELMENLQYIKDWDPERLLSITDFKGKTVLDIGAGTGRLAFAAAPLARVIYASEPVDRLREYMREKAKPLKVGNIRILDGTVEELPFEDEAFDIVLSGHVVGDNWDSELAEISRVTKPGGWIIDCPGEDYRKKSPGEELIKRGFQYSHYASKSGGDVYSYWKQKR